MIAHGEISATASWFSDSDNSVRCTDGHLVDDGMSTSRIMVVDDEPVNIRVVRRYLQAAGFPNLVDCSVPSQAFDEIVRKRPDVLILDITMPEVSGLQILAQLRECESTRRLPVIVLTTSNDRDTRLKALNYGASDFLSRPVDPLELAPRIRNLIELSRYHSHLQNYNRELKAAVRLKTTELEVSRREVLMCLARAAEFRDDDTGQHVLRVGSFAAIIARGLNLPENYVNLIEQAAQLHDVGKIGIPDSILQKPGPLNEEERREIERHSGYGKKILQSLSRRDDWTVTAHSQIGGRILESSHSPLLQMAYRIALTHHERWDGTGYPIGLSGEDIPLEGRITAVADVFDALSTERPYKKAFPTDECFRILMDGRGSHFDPDVIDAFFRHRAEVVQVQMDLLDVD